MDDQWFADLVKIVLIDKKSDIEVSAANGKIIVYCEYDISF